MYNPKLKYIFCVPRLYDLKHNLPMLHYLYHLDKSVHILAGDESIIETLRDEGISFELHQRLPGWQDVLITPGMGLIPFDRHWLEQNLLTGKINVCVPIFLLPSRIQLACYEPEKTSLTHAVCVSDGLTLENIHSYNDDMVYLNTGLPAWDRFQTARHREEVEHIREQYSDRLFVLAVPLFDLPRENDYIYRCIRIGRSMGYRVMVQIHPGFANKLDPGLKDYINPGFTNFALFEAASHVISFVYSTVVMECLNFETKVGCLPYVAKYRTPQDHPWLENANEWYAWVKEKYDPCYGQLLHRIDTDEKIEEFLSDNRPLVTQKQFRDLVRMPDVENFTENCFREIETFLMNPGEDNTRKMIEKTTRAAGSSYDFASWITEKNADAGCGARSYKDFLFLSLELVKQNRWSQALSMLDRAVMFSGNDDFDILQYLRAVCHCNLGELFFAQRCIHQALMMKPDCENYLYVQHKIDSQLPCDYSVLDESKKYLHTF